MVGREGGGLLYWLKKGFQKDGQFFFHWIKNQYMWYYILVFNSMNRNLYRLLYCPCLCGHSFLWWYVVFCLEANLCRFFSFVSICICCWRSSYQEGRVGIPLNGFPLLYVLCLSQARTWISNTICHGLFCVQLRWELVFSIVDIGIDDVTSCLNFLFVSIHLYTGAVMVIITW